MSAALDFVKRDFCRSRSLDPKLPLELTLNGRTESLDYVFIVSGPQFPTTTYVQERINLNPYTKYMALKLDAEYRYKLDMLTKETLSRWFNSKTGLGLTAEDIGTVLKDKDKVTVISSANSMRFKHSFSMTFK